MTSFPVRTTAHLHMRRVLWSVLSHIDLPASTSDSVGQSWQLWWVSVFFVSARCDNWAKNHFTVLYYHVVCRTCPKNRMWSHVHCSMQQKKQSHDAAFFSFQLVSSLWIVTVFVLMAFCWHSVKWLNGVKRRWSRVSDDLVLHQQRIKVAVKMGHDDWLVTQQTSSWLVKNIWIV